MLLEEFLEPMQLSQRDLADGIRVPYQRVNELINRRRGITPATALRLAKYFGNTPGFWMNSSYVGICITPSGVKPKHYEPSGA